MKKITFLARVFFTLLIFSLLCLPVLAEAQIFSNQEQYVSPQPGEVEQKVWDPLERSNKKVFYFNDLLYTDVVKPLTVVYEQLPPSVRKVFYNGFQNLEDPSRIVNFALQGKPRRAGDELTRFVINSTVGVGGMFDVADNALGIQDQDADFGETLGTWSVGPGPYLVVPGLGPMDTRDFVGFAVDDVLDPLFWVPGPFWLTWPADFVKYTGKASDHIDQYEAMKKASLDPYIAMRSAYMEHREAMIANRSPQLAVIPAGLSYAGDNARQRVADQKVPTIVKAKAPAQALAVKQRREQKPRINAPPRELAEALREAVENESGRTPFEAVLQQYPQLAGAVAALNAIAQDADFRPDWGRDNRERLSLATQIISRAVARGDLFTRGRNDPRLDRIREMACDQQRKLDNLEQTERACKTWGG